MPPSVLDPISFLNISRGKVSNLVDHREGGLNSKRPCLLLRDEKSRQVDTHILLLASRAAGLAQLPTPYNRNGESLADGQRPGAAKYIRGLSGVWRGGEQVY